MQRRNFLRLAGLAGATLALPALPGRARAAAPYGGPFWVLVHAAGAWDPRFHFDPIASGPQNRRYTQIGSVGAVQFADYPVDAGSVGLDATQGYDTWLMSNRAFFEKHAGRFTFLNGVDTATNNHEAGTRATWSGRLLGEYPAFGAIVASARAADQPMPLISGGGYDVTSRLVPLARVGDPSTLSKLAVPLMIDPSAADSPRYHT
ncbi:MAG: hypothetical protein FJ104_04350, partial [Deltaproteobacteria bacterium]|nr:hypothetical protein [Deltaproteobacteria bacterium]